MFKAIKNWINGKIMAKEFLKFYHFDKSDISSYPSKVGMKAVSKLPQIYDLNYFNEKIYETSKDKFNPINKPVEMVELSNLAKAMTQQCASPDELVRLVAHSKVIYNAEKYCLDWKQSERDFKIGELITKYLNPVNA